MTEDRGERAGKTALVHAALGNIQGVGRHFGQGLIRAKPYSSSKGMS